jgi:mono/diheme cytochrome c family protein
MATILARRLNGSSFNRESRFSGRVAAVLALALAVQIFDAKIAGADDAVISYNQDIRPLLSDKCFQCHGPDEVAREADLRLDFRVSATADHGDGAAIQTKSPGDSRILVRLRSDDPELRMPPAETKKSLTSAEIALIERWIQQGANYEEHWAFLPIQNPPVPPRTPDQLTKNEIDHFIQARLRRQGISGSSLADPSTQVRRLYLDLLGILPPPAVVERFGANPTDQAYKTLVEQVLADPHYGERWGRHWLDQARYADSHGYTIDGDRIMWPYRDWVIQAINKDVPFDQFTIEQLAGDMLDSPTQAQLVATGFHRNTLINQEGGTDNEQFRNEEVVDRVNTTGSVWLGLTVGCAQCHTHKFDPITQTEFYQLFAFFNHGQDVNNTGPTVQVHENEMFLGSLKGANDEQLQAAEAAVAGLKKDSAKRQQMWADTLLASHRNDGNIVKWTPLEATVAKALSAELQILEDHSILASKGAGKETYTVTFNVAPETPIEAIRLRVIPHESLPENGPGLAGNGNFVLTEVQIAVDGVNIPISRAQASHHQPKFPIEHTFDKNPTTGWAINVGSGSTKKMNAPHEAHFALPSIMMAETSITVTLDHQVHDTFYNIGRFAIDISAVAPQAIVDATLIAALETPVEMRDAPMKNLLANEFARSDVALRQAENSVVAVKTSAGFGAAVNSMIMRDLAKSRETYIHIRGDFLRPDKGAGLLTADVPAILPSLHSAAPAASGKRSTRLDLARWLVRADNPLTARVTVNRVWMRYFGRGLVQTDSDFGTQGSYPSHPELLDWLAHQFKTDGWSMKKLHRKIVTSATYRQSSRARPDLAESDALNHLLARQNRLRVDAEIVRDAALSASGLLSRHIGGPSVRPPQPEGVYAFTQNRKNWKVDSGSDRFRRAIYTRFYRSAPYPLFTTFDTPDFQSVCTARVRSNTPLQSLMMANDQAQFELAKGIASRVLWASKPDGDQSTNVDVEQMFLICFSRHPSANERLNVEAFIARQTERFSDSVSDAAKIAPPRLPEKIEPAVGAAWTSLARALMNTDEFITRE